MTVETQSISPRNIPTGQESGTTLEDAERKAYSQDLKIAKLAETEEENPAIQAAEKLLEKYGSINDGGYNRLTLINPDRGEALTVMVPTAGDKIIKIVTFRPNMDKVSVMDLTQTSSPSSMDPLMRRINAGGYKTDSTNLMEASTNELKNLFPSKSA